MRLPIEKNTNEPKEIRLDPRGIYERGGFGALIEYHPKQRQLVRHATTREIMDKKDAFLCGVDAKRNCFYLRIGEKLEKFDPGTMIPSGFQDLIKEEQ